MTFKKFTDNEKQTMAAEYALGTGLQTLASNFGVSVPTMAKYVRAGGGTIRKPGTVCKQAIVAVEIAVPDLAEVVVSEPVAVPVRVLLPMD
jgi:hypothetical protein